MGLSEARQEVKLQNGGLTEFESFRKEIKFDLPIALHTAKHYIQIPFKTCSFIDIVLILFC